MVDTGRTLDIRVASLLERPRELPAVAAAAIYRARESLALGLDGALAATGVRRINLIAQAVNRVAFAEPWTPPEGWLAVLHRILDAGGDGGNRFRHLLDHTEPRWYYVPRDFAQPLRLATPQPQSHAGAAPGRPLSVGSVSRLALELEELAALLTAHGLDFDAWFPAPLLEATAVSLETGLPIMVEYTET